MFSNKRQNQRVESAVGGEPPSCTLYLVRHGCTVLNANGLLRGHLDPPLDNAGIEEAEALGGEIAGFRPDLIVTSPLRRAVETAEAISRHCGVKPRIEAGLIDRDYGSWAGSSREEVAARWGSLEDAPGVESKESVAARAMAALDGVADCRRVVMVAHDAVNSVILASLEPGRWAADGEVPQRTGCYNVLHNRLGKWIVSEVDIIPHR